MTYRVLLEREDNNEIIGVTFETERTYRKWRQEPINTRTRTTYGDIYREVKTITKIIGVPKIPQKFIDKNGKIEHLPPIIPTTKDLKRYLNFIN